MLIIVSEALRVEQKTFLFHLFSMRALVDVSLVTPNRTLSWQEQGGHILRGFPMSEPLPRLEVKRWV
jgi:hypothetical protein